MPFTVAIAGASGCFGRCLVQKLLNKPGVSVRGLVRDRSKLTAATRSNPSIEIIEGDVTDAHALRKLVKGADIVVSALMGDNSFMFEAQKQLIDTAEDASVPRFLASDYTLDYTTLEYGQLPSKDPIEQTHKYLEKKSI
ncbi:NmrA-like family protein [Stagonosporopsis vannaccii]|nr:NmrA-like family protein [Stagonosporopsis vannaccii]